MLDALGIAQAAVMGHSMGGFIAQALALDYPQRVGKLILAATNFGGPRHVPITPAAMAVLTDTPVDPVTRFRNGLAVSTAPGFAERAPEIIEQWLAWRLANPIDLTGYQGQLAIGLGLLREEACFEPRLAAIAAPTLILTGAHDAVVPPANAELLAQRIPQSRVQVLPDAGHFFPLETPEAAAQAILADSGANGQLRHECRSLPRQQRRHRFNGFRLARQNGRSRHNASPSKRMDLSGTLTGGGVSRHPGEIVRSNGDFSGAFVRINSRLARGQRLHRLVER